MASPRPSRVQRVAVAPILDVVQVLPMGCRSNESSKERKLKLLIDGSKEMGPHQAAFLLNSYQERVRLIR